MNGSFVSDGITLKYKVDDSAWTTIGTLDNNTADSLDAIRYGIWTLDDRKGSAGVNDERNDNMNIVDLYRMRKREQINNKYKELVDKEYNELDVVKEYKELINTFDINMKQLADKYNNNDTQPLVKTAYKNDYSYELSMYLEEEIRSKYNDATEKELKELERLIEEVKAMLYLSDDKDYQLEVLKNYEILDKKGKLNI